MATPESERVTASPTSHTDLYYALSDGGAGNFGFVLAMTVKVHKDGPVAGARLSFTHANKDVFMQGVGAWIEHTQVPDTIPDFRSDVRMVKGIFSLAMATLPDEIANQVAGALAPFYDSVHKLNITVLTNEAMVHSNFVGHYSYYASVEIYTRNVTVSDRLISRSLACDGAKVSQLVATMKELLNKPNALLVILGTNATHPCVGNAPGSSAVFQDWRNFPFLLNIALAGDSHAGWPELRGDLASVNTMQDQVRALAPDSGAYQNEGMFDNPN